MNPNLDPALAAPTPVTDDREYYRAAIGETNADYYLVRFQRFEAEGAFRPDWNWAAFFLGNFWVLYRQQSSLFFIYFLAALAVFQVALAAAGGMVAVACWALLSFVVFPIYANGLYYLHVRGLVDKAKRTLQQDSERFFMLRNGGVAPGRRRGISWPVWGVVGIVISLLAAVTCACGGRVDYTLRAKCTEAIIACSPVKEQVAEFALKNDRLPASFAEMGQQPPAATKWVKSVELRQDATIVATLRGEREFEGKKVVFQPTLGEGKVTWVCGTPAEMTFYKYLPAECRRPLQ